MNPGAVNVGEPAAVPGLIVCVQTFGSVASALEAFQHNVRFSLSADSGT